jgi:hypothetical protein
VHLSGPPDESAQLAVSIGAQETGYPESLGSDVYLWGKVCTNGRRRLKSGHYGISAAFQNPLSEAAMSLRSKDGQTILAPFGNHLPA